MDENTLNDLLECSVCLDRLDTSSKVLPCQHTFCRKCLEVIHASHQELRCPECRVLVETKIDDLPPNVLLMRILEGMKNTAACRQQTNSNGNGISTATKVTDQEFKRKQQQMLEFQEQLKKQQNQTHLKQQTSNTNQNQNQSLNQQSSALHSVSKRRLVPHAYALHDYQSKMASDLNFKKGDLILLKRRIDNNWYMGQVQGVDGVFPVNFVQIVVPLPIPQCVALYDFKMGPNEEEGCLTFKKGTIIQVIRRVDHNWAEGRIGASIGIFPIAFVELNTLARQQLDNVQISHQLPSSRQSQHTEQIDSRLLPAVPFIDPTADANNGDSTTTSSSSNSSVSVPSSSSTSSSNTTSPVTATTNSQTSGTNFHSLTDSSQSLLPNTSQHTVTTGGANHNISTTNGTSVRLRNSDMAHKRHSLNALLNAGSTNLSISQVNRHSAEILSVPSTIEDNTTNFALSQPTTEIEQQDIQQQTQSVVEQPQNIVGLPPHFQHKGPATSPVHTQTRHNVLKTTCVQQNIPSTLPWGYLALYPYKPLKNDELELKKGCVYIVTERCLDGWFKGKNWKGISGVFPGNYVTPLRARDQQQLMHGWKFGPPASTTNSVNQNNSLIAPSSASASIMTQQQQLPSNCRNSMRHDLENLQARVTVANLTPHQILPPDLPPRHLTLSPKGQTSNNNNTKEHKEEKAVKQKHITTGCISTSSSSGSSGSTTATGLKKFLTHIKTRSKSPSSSVSTTQKQKQKAQSPANPTPPSTMALKQKNAQPNTLTPVHVRSGSCPSQLLQNLSSDRINCQQINEQQPQQPQQPLTSQISPTNAQRLKANNKNRTNQLTKPTIDSTLRSIYANQLQQQWSATAASSSQSNLVMLNKCSQQYQQQQQQQHQQSTSSTNNNFSSEGAIHRKSHSLDASNILQSITLSPTTSSIPPPPPPSGGSENIAQSNVDAKSTETLTAIGGGGGGGGGIQNNSDESRFRCVVSYPPNSNIELELHLGDIIFVKRKQKNGWYMGTNSRTNKTGLFPASFVERDI
uniref:RING-type E3 ubiquitin transferase n=1 Tax=Glossina brevipalpis TaxID=37001 RepID=A0A1A9WDT5_9MUSC